ncbi:hypothetical protein SAMN05660841_03281 [Sphingobacterium nematocida]|uniref:Uncharacterized protein n=1 Tax=Sphingobacterium nematocida TaxID=1513896 RepID=A0A1T5FI54_9SPHI|nr:hypothetical protein [Sphingobacterium nematocida]SKB95860.1 hypothetical protein SAMN05660841_03281 [Sphingobacterium nematocida]
MKRLLFAALFATVAIGGAYAQYTTVQGGTTSQFNCNGVLAPLCRASAPIYQVGSSTPVTDDAILDRTRVNN